MPNASLDSIQLVLYAICIVRLTKFLFFPHCNCMTEYLELRMNERYMCDQFPIVELVEC